MKLCITAAACLLLGAGVFMLTTMDEGRAEKSAPAKREKSNTPAVLNFRMTNLAGQKVDLSRYAGKVVLIVNTASKCGFTPQYKGLQQLHEEYSGQGLAILGFPANDFGQQEPGTDAEIGAFCKKNYGVSFDMFSKITVVGPDAAPLYQFLTDKKTNPKFAGPIKWNFEKFLIGRDGKIRARFASRVAPTSDEMTRAIKAALAAK